MPITEGSANVAADSIWDGNYIRRRSTDPWMRVVGDDESVGPVMTYYGPNGEELTIAWQDTQLTVKTELVPAQDVREDDEVQHPELGDWVTLRRVTHGTIITRTGAGERKSRQLTFRFEVDGHDLGAEFDSYLEIPGVDPVAGTPKNHLIWRRVRD